MADITTFFVTGDEVGHYFKDKDGSLWKMVGYCDQPQATFQRIDGGAGGTWGQPVTDNVVVTHVVGCLNYQAMGLKRMDVRP